MNNLHSLIKSGRSGIVAICGDPENRESLEYMIYYHSLGAIYIHGEVQDQYFNADATGLVSQALDTFAAREDKLTLAELGIDETTLLGKELEGLLWHMVHDYDDDPGGDDEAEWLDKSGLLAPDSSVFDPCDMNFTIFGSGDLETDIARFGELARTGGEFSVAGHDFSLGSGMDTDGNSCCSIGIYYTDSLTDDGTGEQIPVKLLESYLLNYDWRNLYARARVFIFQNYMRPAK